MQLEIDDVLGRVVISRASVRTRPKGRVRTIRVLPKPELAAQLENGFVWEWTAERTAAGVRLAPVGGLRRFFGSTYTFWMAVRLVHAVDATTAEEDFLKARTTWDVYHR